MQLEALIVMGKHPPTVVMALTEKLQEPKQILSELIILQHFGT